MKTLKKISLHNVGDVMQDSEMKRIFGGYTDASYSSWCRPGERLFSCKADLTNEYTERETTFDLGAICAKDGNTATRMAYRALQYQGAIVDPEACTIMCS